MNEKKSIRLYYLSFLIAAINGITVYVGRNGSDHPFCGNQTDACGTLFMASSLLNQTVDWLTADIYVIDGQNETEISNLYTQNYSDPDNYDPCLPKTFKSTHYISITFDHNMIHYLNDWYPLHLCYDYPRRTYSNQYMFDGGRSLTINNLIINDYIISDNNNAYSLIRSTDSPWTANIICNNCIFRNITSFVSQLSFIHSTQSIHLYNNTFTEIQTIGNIIFADHDEEFFGYMNIRNVVLEHTSFQHIESESILYLAFSQNDQGSKSSIPQLVVDFCNFYDVYTQVSIIIDETWSCNAAITNTEIDIVFGSIYYPQHDRFSIINISNVSITSNQMKDDTDALLHIGTSDESYLTNIDILYEYHLLQSCYDAEGWLDWWDNWIDSSLCANPITLIDNSGYISLRDITLNMDIFSPTQGYGDKRQYAYEGITGSDADSAFIINRGRMDITRMNVIQLICFNFITNENALSISYFSLYSHYVSYNPNSLHSNIIIFQSGTESTLFVDECDFGGSETQVYAGGGKNVEISNSRFQTGLVLLQLYAVARARVTNCTFEKSGRYFTRSWSHQIYSTYVSSGISIWFSDDIIFSNNIVSGFDDHGLLFIFVCTNIIFVDNEFGFADLNDFYYGIYNGFERDFAPVTMRYTENSMFIRNRFASNVLYSYIDTLGWNGYMFWEYSVDVPWILYASNDDIHCLSSNTFTDFAILSIDTNLTSCLRPNLMNCMQTTVTECFSEIYGYENTDQSLRNEMGTFIVNGSNNPDMLIYTERGSIAIDNIVITVVELSNGPTGIAFIQHSGYILLVDSYLDMNYDILYNYDAKVISNNRLLDDTQYISYLLMYGSANYSKNHPLNSTMTSPNTQLVNHLSPIKINITTTTTSHYPGESIKFEYQVLDMLDNKIDYNSSVSTVIYLEGTSFSTEIIIQPDGTCARCKAVSLDIITISEVGQTFTMDVFIKNNVLYPINDELTLDIVGCPVGFGPDSNNLFCDLCSIGYYNILRNNLDECNSCNTEYNGGIDCIDGNIFISSNHWMGFVDGTISSSICPNQVCCQSTYDCNYLDDKGLLCALNRDYTSPLCGKCNNGYSESINSNECIKCESAFYPQYLLYPIALSIIILLLKIPSNTDPIDPNKRKTHLKEMYIKNIISSDYFKVMMKTLIFKNILYYQQGISQTLQGSAVSVFMASFAGFFNLNTTFNASSGNNPWCFIDGLNGKQKILIDFIVPVVIFISIGLLWLISLVVCNGMIRIKEKKVNFAKLFLSTFLIIIGNILSVLFRLLNCQTIGDKKVHFYFGYEECYGMSWLISLISLIVIYIAFSFIFIKVWKMEDSQRQKPNIFGDILHRYKPQFYYWEYVLFSRRIIIAFFAVSITGIVSKFAFIAIMFIFAFAQYKYEPFITDEANTTEIILMFCFIFVIITQLASSKYSILINVIISFLIIYPLLLMTYYIYQVFKKRKFKTREQMLFDLRVSDTKKDNVGIECVDKHNTKNEEQMGENSNDDNIDTVPHFKALDIGQLSISADNSSSSSDFNSVEIVEQKRKDNVQEANDSNFKNDDENNHSSTEEP